ncbi:hypothetical protein EON65_48540, partial [archaeon]
MSLDEQLNLRVVLFSYDLINKVVNECRNNSYLDNKDEVYESLSSKWRSVLATKGGIPLNTAQRAPMVTPETLKKDPRLSAFLPPVDSPMGLNGRPGRHMVLQTRTAGGTLSSKQAVVKKSYTIKDPVSISSPGNKRGYEVLTTQQIRTSLSHTHRKKIRSSADTPSTHDYGSALDSHIAHRQDVILGSLLLLDLTKVSADWRQQYGLPTPTP